MIRRWTWPLLVIAFAGCAAPVPPTVHPGSPPPRATESAAPVPSMGAGLGWQRIQLAADRPINPLFDVIENDRTLYVAGSIGDDRVAPLIARSTDGIEWTPEPISSDFGTPSSLYAVGGRLFAVGAGGTANCAHPFAIDTWARGADATWTEAPWKEALCAGLEWATLLDRGDSVALLGVGFGEVPLSWSSADGLHWRDLRPDPKDIYLRAAVVDGDDVLGFGGDVANRPVAVRSKDGHTFRREPFPAVPPDSVVRAAVRLGPDLDVFLDEGGATLGLARRDASGWSSGPTDGIRADQVTRILTVGDRLIALGNDGTQPLAWSSGDGVTWTALVLPNGGPDTSISGAARIGDVAVLVGAADTPDGSRTVGAVWVGSAELLGG